jgi:hypothetical protein
MTYERRSIIITNDITFKDSPEPSPFMLSCFRRNMEIAAPILRNVFQFLEVLCIARVPLTGFPSLKEVQSGLLSGKSL